MSGLESDDEIRVFLGGIRRQLNLNCVGSCSADLTGAGCGNIQKREDPHFRAVNDFLEVFEAVGAGGSTVTAGGDSRRQQ
jgi:hypothetical protein